jgi:hypothetical protein
MQAGDVKFPRVALFRAVIFIRQVSSGPHGISGLALQLLGTLTRPEAKFGSPKHIAVQRLLM